MLMSTAAVRSGTRRTFKAIFTVPESSVCGSLDAAIGTVKIITGSTQNVHRTNHSRGVFQPVRRRHTWGSSWRSAGLSTWKKSAREEVTTRTRKACEWRPVNLAYLSYERKASNGLKSPLVVQHGLFGCKENWKKMSKEINLISKRSVFALDARNHGESPHSGEMSLELMAKDVRHFASSQVATDKISFMGHNFGGRIGMMLAMMYPNVLDKLVVVDTSPLPVQDSAYRYSRILQATAVLKNMEPELRQCSQGYKCGLIAEKAIEHILKDKRDIAVVLSNLKTPGGTVSSKAREVTTNGVKTDPNSLWKVNLDSILSNPCLTDFPDFDERVAYKGKTLFIQGEKSQQMKPSDEHRIKRLFPNAEFIWLEETGQWLHLEKHTEFLHHVLKFLERK